MSLGPDIVTRGLVLALDAADKRSYPGSGTTWFDLVNSYNGTLTNGLTFDSGNGGSIEFDGTDDFVNGPATNSVIGNNLSSITLSSRPVTGPIRLLTRLIILLTFR